MNVQAWASAYTALEAGEGIPVTVDDSRCLWAPTLNAMLVRGYLAFQWDDGAVTLSLPAESHVITVTSQKAAS